MSVANDSGLDVAEILVLKLLGIEKTLNSISTVARTIQCLDAVIAAQM